MKKKYTHSFKSKLNREDKKIFRTRFSEKSMWKGVTWTAVYLQTIYCTIGLCFWVVKNASPSIASVALVLVCIVVVVRQMRALENIVHFGSHNNFSPQKKLNDWSTNLLAAWPMLQEVRCYREYHMAHHGDFGSHKDPCKRRLESIGADSQNITTNMQLILVIMRWMPKYVREYYIEVKSKSSQVAIFVAWHGVAGLVLGLAFSWALAAFTIVMWMSVMFLILPFLRSIAEFSEHDYERGNSVTETTFNNLGLVDHLLLHPAGDAWHVLHHLFPTVSWWQQGAAHRFLMKRDSAYTCALHRDELFQNLTHFPNNNGSEMPDGIVKKDVIIKIQVPTPFKEEDLPAQTAGNDSTHRPATAA